MAVSQQTFARKKPDQLVYLELGSGNGGMLLSVAEDGFRFRAVSPLRPDGGVPFAFSLDGKHRLQGIGEVEWLEDDGKSGGMRFVDLSPENRAAIDQWLAVDSRPHSDREATSADATPLDTMEKIREELRSGYPARPADEKRGSQREAQAYAPAFKENPAPPEQPKPKTRFVPPTPKPPLKPPAKPPSPPSTLTNSAFLKIPRETLKENPPAPAISGASAGVPAAAVPPASVRPPFTEPAPEIPATPAVTAPSAAAAKLNAAAPLPSLRTFTVNDAGDVSSATVPIRPYIPPPDDSYDQAWANSKLTVPAESPHLSRAAAGAIIGIALLVIVSALAFNFRQDIGTLFIDLGQKISGANHSAEPTSTPVQQNPADSGTVVDGQPGDAGNSVAKSEGAPAPGANLSSSTPAGSATSNVGAAPTSDGRPANETGGKSTSAASKTAGRNPAPNAVAPNPVPRDTKPTTPAERTVKPVEAPPVTEPVEGESGLEEFNLARDFLKSGNRQQDLPRAVALLWSGVRKGYVPAEVTLADLYRRGEGVEKNCDQARVLLVAASKKGSPDARRMLEFMAENGCE
jgi:hypothetical protein